MADVFISYKRDDRELAMALDAYLQKHDITTWWDTSLIAGEVFNAAIERELQTAGCIVVLWNEASHASSFVQAEAMEAFTRKNLVSARLDGVALKYPYGIVQTADLRGWRGEDDHPGLYDLIRGIAEKLGRRPPPRPAKPAPERKPAPPAAQAPLDYAEETPKRAPNPVVIGGAAVAVIAALGLGYVMMNGAGKQRDTAQIATQTAPVVPASLPATTAEPVAPPTAAQATQSTPRLQKVEPKPSPPAQSASSAKPPVEAAPAKPAALPTGARGEAQLSDIKWLRRPTASDISRYYPDKALRQSKSGEAVIRCELYDGGPTVPDPTSGVAPARVDKARCTVVSEMPADMGFGVAAVQIAQRTMRAELGQEGRQFSVPFKFAVQ